MGTMYGLRCKDCGFEAELGTEQPYYVMSGAAITDKYCPKTGEIVWVSEGYNTSNIACQDEEWQNEFGKPALCRNCKGECLQELEMRLPAKGKDFRGYKCPRCGGELNTENGVFSISLID